MVVVQGATLIAMPNPSTTIAGKRSSNSYRQCREGQSKPDSRNRGIISGRLAP